MEALVAKNRHVAEILLPNHDMGRVRTRVRLAYRESGSGGFVPWLLAQMDKKARLRSQFVPIPASDTGSAAAFA